MKYISLFVLCICSLLPNITSLISINVYGTGLFLPYSLGVLGYIKKHIPISNYEIVGVSGGSWCSLLYAFEDDLSEPDKIWDYMVGNPDYKVRLHSNMPEFQKKVETNMLLRYKHIDNNKLKNIYIIATRYHHDKVTLSSEKVGHFYNIHDLIEFCSCSSYIPYISGVLMCKQYKNKYYMDGDVIRDYKLNKTEKSINIHRTMWGKKFKFQDFIYTDKNKSIELFSQGWNDTKANHHKLMDLFQK